MRGSTGSTGSAEELDDERWTTRRILEHWMRSLRRILTIPRMKADAFIRADAFITLGALPNAAINAIDEKDHAIPWQRTDTSRAMWGWPRLGVGQDERATRGRRQPEDMCGDRMAGRCQRDSRNRRRVLDGGSMPA